MQYGLLLVTTYSIHKDIFLPFQFSPQLLELPLALREGFLLAVLLIPKVLLGVLLDRRALEAVDRGYVHSVIEFDFLSICLGQGVMLFEENDVRAQVLARGFTTRVTYMR